MPHCQYDGALIGPFGSPIDRQTERVSELAARRSRLGTEPFARGPVRPRRSLTLLVIGCVLLVFLSWRAMGSGLQPILSGRLVGARYGAKTDRQSVPPVDGDDCQGQVNQFGFTETAASLPVNLILYMPLADQRDRLRPGERGSFTLA